MLAVQSTEVVAFRAPLPNSSTRRSYKPLTLDDYLAQAAVRRLQAKEHIFCEGDPKKFVYQLVEGVAIFYRMLSDGRRQVIDFAYPGDLIGLGIPGDYIFSAQAAGPAKVRCIPASALEVAAHHDPDLALKLYKAVSLELSAARAILTAIGQRSAVERIATFLVMLHQRSSDANKSTSILQLPMRRSDIADLLGLTIETVSRTITKLRVMGVIAVDHGSTICILKLDELKDLAAGE